MVFPDARALVRNDPGVARLPGGREGKPLFRVRGGAGAGTVESARPIVGTVGPDRREVALVGLDAGGRNGYGVFLAYVAARALHVAVLPGGDVAKFVAGNVVVFRKSYDPTAPNCCPRSYRATTFVWRGDALAPAATRTVPASALRQTRATSAGRFVRRADAPAPSTTYAWLRGAWIGHCFPDFVDAMGGGEGAEPLVPARRERIAGGVWAIPFSVGTLPPFLRDSVVDAAYVSDGTLRRVLALGYDPSNRTAVFAHVGPEDSFAGYVRVLATAPAGIPRIAASRAVDASVPLAIGAAPPAPSFARLVAILGRPSASRVACGDREVAYASTGDTPTILMGIYDTSGRPVAFGVQRATGG